jgi:hypothetical protein
MRDDVQIFVETWGKRFTLPLGSLSRARSEQHQVREGEVGHEAAGAPPGPYGHEHARERVTKAERHV